MENIQNIDPKDHLLMEGLKGYLYAKRAIQAFENLIAEAVKEVMARHLEKLRLVTGSTDLLIQNLQTVGETFPHSSKLGVVRISFPAPDTAGIYIGVKWAQSGTLEVEKPQAYISVTFTADNKRQKLFRVLNSSEKCKGISVDKPAGWPYEVHLSNPLPVETTFDSLQESMEKVLLCFIEIINDAGNLQSVLSGQIKDNA